MSDESGREERSSTQRIWRFLAARFDPKSELGLGLTVSLVVCALAVWALSGLLDAVLDNELLVRIDITVESWFHGHATPTGLTIFNAVTQLGSPVVADILASPTIASREKRRAILRAVGTFQDSTTEVISREEWRSMAQDMGVEKMGGVAPTPARQPGM